MFIRTTLLCAVAAVLTACSAYAPTSQAGAKAPAADTVKYPNEYNQFRMLGWDAPASN